MKIFLRSTFFLFFYSCFFYSCKTKDSLFRLLSSGETNIHFNNKIVENDSINPIDMTNVYNGGGVGIGDFNNDGLKDIYFTGNLVSNKLYLNKGGFKFKDITQEAGVEGEGKWCRGVAVVDINNDGWQDIYVCVTMEKDPSKRENLLYVNKGNNKDGIPHFTEMAREYGLNDTTHSTMAAFFDYDNDGDLDMYLAVNEIIKTDNPAIFRPKITDGTYPSTGRLYRNDWSENLKHAVFKNVSREAGVTIEGYGHAVTIADLNKDGWKDIFVTNDFNSNDLLYINNHDGTFTDKASSYFKHTSANGMGQDVIDINNDGLSDIIELDMNPQDNYRKKMMMNANSYQTYQNSDYFGYQYQYVRNTLQLNQGPRVTHDSIGDPVFSDVGFFSGIAETDWSWTPVVQDFDNDGFRDIIITNGFPKDVTDHDFIAFRNESYSVATKEYTLAQIPQVKIHNYAYRNNGNITFNNETYNWGLDQPSFSNGAAYADLDNDGDLDLVINNIDDEASVYENTLSNKKDNDVHFLAIKLLGDSLNRNGLGTWIELYYGQNQQVIEVTPYRGYLSTDQLDQHFGLGKISKIDSVIIKWQDGKKQVIRDVPVDKMITVNKQNADQQYTWSQNAIASNRLFSELILSAGLQFNHQQRDYIDFNIQKLLPHKFSEYGPALAVGDVNRDGLDDIVVGGNTLHGSTILLQQGNGSFLQKVLQKPFNISSREESVDMGISMFDFEGDGDLDVYIASGGYESRSGSAVYRDKLYINDGKGNFAFDSTGIPQNFISKSCVRVCDYDKDGDLDLFIAGRVEPWKYPQPVSSFIYRNDSRNGHVKFTDVTATVASSLDKIGLVCDAVFTDFDNDGWQDLIVTGEWMPIKFLRNVNGVFKDISAASGVNNKIGWWTSIVPGDFDNDGKTDYILGNLGLNSFYRGNEKYPVKIYAKDFDNNGNYDAVPALFLPVSQTDTTRKEFPAHVRDDMAKQMIMFKSKFQNYKSYATATIDQMFTAEELKGALILQANYFQNSYLKNLGNGKFEMTPLPNVAQFSCLNGMLAEDFDADGNLDLLITGNDYGAEVSVGRYDACNGLFLKGNGKGGFTPLSILQSGWYVPGNGKALVKLRGTNGKTLLAASQNKGPLKVFQWNRNDQMIPLQAADVSAVIKYKNGAVQLREINYGSSFLSQSGRFLNVDKNVASVQVKDNKGTLREIKIQ